MKRYLVMTRDAVLSGSHWFVSRYRAQPFPNIAGTCSAGSPSRHFHRTASRPSLNRRVGQISPDKNVNCRYTTAAFTLSPESGASSCCADLPGDWALYAISVPRIESGAGSAHSFALRLPLDGPSRFRPCLWLVLVSVNRSLTGFTYRGLSPHEFTPMPGVHNFVKRTRWDTWCCFLQVPWPRAAYDRVTLHTEENAWLTPGFNLKSKIGFAVNGC
jgi:hypothetical protein